jgi:uncharacterized membrane protein YphA (DoxX/SURF4 family)
MLGMLNTFPYLLSFGLLAPFILRVAVGVYFLKTGLSHLKINRHTGEEVAIAENAIHPAASVVWGVAIIEAIAGLALIAGFLTQISALVLSILLVLALIFKKGHLALFKHSTSFYLLLLVVCLSLIVSGAGFWAIDIPL